MEGAWVKEVVVHVVVVGLWVEVVVVVGEINVGYCGSGGGGRGVRWRVEEVVGNEGVRSVVVKDLTVGLVGARGGGVLISGEHYGRRVTPFVVQHVSLCCGSFEILK